MNAAQSDKSDWMSVFKKLKKVISDARSKGMDRIAEIAEARLPLIQNEIISLASIHNSPEYYNVQHEPKIINWLNALQILGFQQYLINKEFEPTATMDRRLQMFVDHRLATIPVSEAAVERNFSAQKLVHSKVRASLSDDVVNDILFIRYNKKKLCPNFFNDDLDLDLDDGSNFIPFD